MCLIVFLVGEKACAERSRGGVAVLVEAKALGVHVGAGLAFEREHLHAVREKEVHFGRGRRCPVVSGLQAMVCNQFLTNELFGERTFELFEITFS